MRLNVVAHAGHRHDDDGLRRAHDLDLGLAGADRLDDDGVEAAASSTRTTSRVAAASPPTLPRLAMLRM